MELVTDLTIICFITLFMEAIDACVKLNFEIVEHKLHPGITLETTSSITMEACRRMCRLTVECYRYNMMWPSTVERSIGTCQLLPLKRPGDQDILKTDHSASYYGKEIMIICLQLCSEMLNYYL
jgi:hypothetical protein